MNDTAVIHTLGRFVKSLGSAVIFGVVAVFILASLIRLIGSGPYVIYVAISATEFDIWSVLSILEVLLSLTAIIGAGFALRRRRPVAALAFSALGLPMTFVIEGSRCDTEASCRQLRWAAVPASTREWSIRIRPIAEESEAQHIASDALSRAGISDSPFQTRLVGDHWIVSTIDEDGRPGRHALKIDRSSTVAQFVPCPADLIRCGMEWPQVSDGRRPFRNERLGLAATFPASAPVCSSRGDDVESRGFYAYVRAPTIPCDDLDGSRSMGVALVEYPLNGCTRVDAPSTAWRPLSAEVSALLQRPSPRLAGRQSLACELRENEYIQISVYTAAAARFQKVRSPAPLFEAHIVTTTANLAEDIRAFETFLGSVSIR